MLTTLAPPPCANELESVFDRSMDEVADWERGVFDKLTGGRKTPVILCGAGGLGRKLLQGLRVVGIEPIAFTDNNPLLWGQRVEGIEVLKPSDAALRYGQEAAFVISIWGANSSDRLVERKMRFENLGCRCVVSFHSLFWKYPDIFLPHYTCDLPHKVYAAQEEIEEVYHLWSDEYSRDEYVAQLKWRSRLDYEGLPDPVAGVTYFPSGLYTSLGDAERFIDCGAFQGDTLEEFLGRFENSFQHYLALEPDPGNFADLRRLISALPKPIREKIDALPYAAYSHQSILNFLAEGSASSAITEIGNVEVPAEAIDRILAGSPLTFLKMDIEGGEPQALEGARRSLERHRPVVAVSAYHLQDHLWKLPAWLNGVLEDYNFYLRPHDMEIWDLVCYAVPQERTLS